MKELMLYAVPFILTMYICYTQEKKTNVSPAIDKEEFDKRMVLIALGLIVFIVIHFALNRLSNLPINNY